MAGTMKCVGVLVLLALAVMGACIIVQQHAVQRHGSLVDVTRAQMDHCKDFPGAELCDGSAWLYLLFFPGDKACFQVCSGPRENPDSREITTVPAEHMSRPRAYIEGLFERGYTFKQAWGDVPQWFSELTKVVME